MIGNFENRFILKDCFQHLIIENNAEYADCYNYGIKKEIFSDWGFEIKDESKIIIPNYFEPFIQNNIKLKFAVKTTSPFYIFKGDSDQDRPSIL